MSYEQREEFLEAATRAITDTLGAVPPNLHLKLGDIYLGVEERDMDRVLLDLPEPWQAIPAVCSALRPGGIVFAHCPNVSQVQRFFDGLREVRGFGMLEVLRAAAEGLDGAGAEPAAVPQDGGPQRLPVLRPAHRGRRAVRTGGRGVPG